MTEFEVRDRAGDARVVLSTMRYAILRAERSGDAAAVETGLRRGNDLARAVGQLAARYTLGDEIADEDVQAADTLLADCRKDHWHYPAASRRGSGIIHDLLEFLGQLDTALQQGKAFTFNRGGWPPSDNQQFAAIFRRLGGVICAPFSSDLIYAHAANAIIQRRLGYSFQIVPAVTDPDDPRAVLPADTPVIHWEVDVDEAPVYLDANSDGATRRAVMDALRARHDAGAARKEENA